MLVISRIMEQNYSSNKFGIFLVYGESGIGKSVYSILALREIGLNWKEHLFFRPNELLSKIDEIYSKHGRIKALVLDDASFSLSSYDWHDPFAKAFIKFISVARPVLANIILTTPSPKLLLKKLVSMDAWIIKIVYDTDKEHKHRRIAKGYKNYLLPNGKRIIRLSFEDWFNINSLEREIFREYNEYRYSYVKDGLENLFIELKHREKAVGDDRTQFIQP
jgi:hypothetical protein